MYFISTALYNNKQKNNITKDKNINLTNQFKKSKYSRLPIEIQRNYNF